jgi:hypothetical protein
MTAIPHQGLAGSVVGLKPIVSANATHAVALRSPNAGLPSLYAAPTATYIIQKEYAPFPMPRTENANLRAANQQGKTKRRWTTLKVEEQLASAADVLSRLSSIGPQGYFSTWPSFPPEFSDLVGREPEPMKRPPPSPRAISNMDETLYWTIGLEPRDARIVWLIAENKDPMKVIGAKVGLCIDSVTNHWLCAIYTITWRLNGKPIPKKWSRRRILAAIRAEEDQ